jgi:hypothetical protein
MNILGPNPSSTRTSPSAKAGFTLIEVIGIMTVLGLLTMAVVPSLIREFDREARSRESKNLERLSDGLVQYVQRTHTIPAATTFPVAIAGQLGLHTNDVIRTDRGNRRVFLMDPAVTNRLPIPYTQTSMGATNNLGTALGAVIISSAGATLPAGLTNGFATNSTVFQAIWTCTEGQIPTGLGFTGSGEDLKIQRINFSTLFNPLILNYDTTSTTNQGRYTIDASSTNVLPSQPVFTSNFIKGTVLGLHDHAGSTNAVQAREVLQHPMSYIFQADTWRGTLFVGTSVRPPPTGVDLQAAQDVFVSAPQNSTAQGNPQSTPPDVIQTMLEFMTNYVNWVNSGFPSSGTIVNNLTNSQQHLDDTTEDLLHRPDVDDEDNDPDGTTSSGTEHGADHDDCDHSHGHCNHDGQDHTGCNHRRHHCNRDGQNHSGCGHHRGWCNRDGHDHSHCNHSSSSSGHCDHETSSHTGCNHTRNVCNNDGHSHSGCNHSRGCCVHDGNNHGSCNHGSGWCNHDGNSHWSCDHSRNRCNNRDDDDEGSSTTVGCRTFWKKGRR